MMKKNKMFEIGTVITPKDLDDFECYKITNEEEIHHGLNYKDGLIIDPIEFLPFGQCITGGMYFFTREQLPFFSEYVDNPYWIRKITFPDDAKIYVETNKFKCDKFILGPRKKFNIFDFSLTEEEKITVVKSDGSLLMYLKDASEAVQLAAVKSCNYAIQYINEPTEEMKLISVKKYCYSIRHIKNPSEELQLIAVKQSGWVIRDIVNPSEAVQIAAVTECSKCIVLIENPSKNVQLAANMSQ